MPTIKKTEATDGLRTNEKKWTKALMDAGWTAFPSIIVEKQLQLGLDPLDMNILLHLASRWWTPEGKPYPSKGSIAAAMKVHPRTVQRHIAEMEGAGLIRREERRVTASGSKTNIYHLEGLIESVTPFAQEKLEDLAERDAAKKAKALRKGKPRLRVVKSD